ncbi:MAG: glycosyltransferase, partial [Prochlorotrichaceae cyanobacterium]
WSCLEALSTGCLVVASATPPVQEVIVDQVNGFLVDFFHPRAIAAKVAEVLDRGQELTEVRTNARKTIMEYYSLRELLTVQLQWLKSHAR